jgi:hypothetical protein
MSQYGLREQQAFTFPQQGKIQRKTIAPPGQGNYVQFRTASPQLFADEEIETKLPARTMPRSAIRYRSIAPAQPQAQPKPRRHWLVYVGIAFFVMIFGWIALTALGNWWQTKLDDWKYGYPRTFQTDANVGHFNYTSHFVAMNLNGKIEIIETEPANPNQQQSTHMYIAATLAIDENLQPVTLKFEDLTGHGRLDMLVFVGNSLQVPLYNNGTTFQTQPPNR